MSAKGRTLLTPAAPICGTLIAVRNAIRFLECPYEKVSNSLRHPVFQCKRYFCWTPTAVRHHSFSDFCDLWREEVKKERHRYPVPSIYPPLWRHRLLRSS